MRVLEPLYEHGQHVLPIYAAGERVAASSASVEEVKKRGGVRLRPALGRYDKEQRAADRPQAYGWIKAIYPEAIEFTAMRQELEGMPMIQAAIGLMVGGIGAVGGGGDDLAVHILNRRLGLSSILFPRWLAHGRLLATLFALHGRHPGTHAVGRPAGFAGDL
jgi:hypothetical protein